MKNPGSSLLAAALLLMTFATTSLITTPANAYQCSSQSRTAIGSGGTRAYALINSRKIWSNYIKRQLGLAWSGWNIAAKRSTRCKKLRRSHTPAKWSCTREARPCLYIAR